MIRAFADNVILVLEPLDTTTKSGLAIVQKKAKWRVGRVVSSGPGHYKLRRVRESGTLMEHTEEQTVFVPNQAKDGDRVIVESTAGQDYTLDFSVPRQNKAQIYDMLGGERGEFRIVRDHEILAVIDDDTRAEDAA